MTENWVMLYGEIGYRKRRITQMRLEAYWLFDRLGHWKCSSCGYMEGRIAEDKRLRAYCPVCGARMKGTKYECREWPLNVNCPCGYSACNAACLTIKQEYAEGMPTMIDMKSEEMS